MIGPLPDPTITPTAVQLTVEQVQQMNNAAPVVAILLVLFVVFLTGDLARRPTPDMLGRRR